MIALIPVNHTILTWHSLLYQTNLPLDHSPHQMTIFRIERLSPIETQKHCISNSLKYNASLHFLYRHVDIITLLSCTLSGSDCIYQKRSQQFIHTLLTPYTTYFNRTLFTLSYQNCLVTLYFHSYHQFFVHCLMLFLHHKKPHNMSILTPNVPVTLLLFPFFLRRRCRSLS